MLEYLPLKKVNAPYEEAIQAAMRRVVESGWYLFGQEVAAFEADWATYCGVPQEGGCVACANGLDALRMVLRAWVVMGKVQPGDEVIVPANTYIASILAVSDAGLKPVPVEPNPHTYLIDPENVERAITPRTKIILPVHLYGQICPMEALMDIAHRHHLLVLEDCAQCHGVAPHYQGDAQAWSFYPGKNLGALGDAGAVTSADSELLQVVRQLGFYGSQRKYVHDYKGLNSRMDEVQAAVLRVKIPDLDHANRRRQEIAQRYLAEVKHSDLVLPTQEQNHVWHIFPVLTTHRDDLQRYLLDQGVQTQIHYPIPPHRQKAYSEWSALSFPITERIAAQELSLPCHPAMTDAEVTTVIEMLNDCNAKPKECINCKRS